MRLENKVAVITGASRGIGRAVAIEFAREGASVVVWAATDTGATQEVADAVRGLGREAMPVIADVAKRDEVRDAMRKVLDKFGRIDILVNNAGVIHPAKFLELSEEQWDKVIGVHLKGTFNCTQAVAKHMVDRRAGKIINVTAPSALRASSGIADYASAKGAIISFTKAVAKELAPFRINVNCLSPVAHTRMTDSLMATRHTTIEQHASRYPLGWFAEPEEVAPAFVFFACRDSDYVTGQVLAVDGGLTM